MVVRYLASAREEAFAAADYYERQATGLGADFFAVLDGAIDLIVAAPGIGGEFELRTRRLVLPRFPYTRWADDRRSAGFGTMGWAARFGNCQAARLRSRPNGDRDRRSAAHYRRAIS
jgi:hypothetical protein